MGYGLSGLSQLSLRPRSAEEVLLGEVGAAPVSLAARPPQPVNVPAGAIAGEAAAYSLPPRVADAAPAPAPMDPYSLAPRIKAAASDPVVPPVLNPRDIKAAATEASLPPRGPLPPMTTSIAAGSGPEVAMPPGMSLAPRPAVMDGRPPTPPLRSYSESYGRFQDERAALPSEGQYLEANKPKGFWNRAGEAAKLAGKLFLTSGFNPLIAAAGGVLGAVDPNAENRFSYRTDIEPRSRARQDLLLRQAGTELGMHNTIEDNRRAEQQMELTNAWHRLQLQTRDDLEREKLQQRLLDDWMTRNPGVPIPEQIAAEAGRPYLSGYKPPARPLAGRTTAPRWELNEQGVYVDLNDPRNTNVRGYQKPDTPTKLTDDDYEAAAMEGSDPSGERTRRIDEWIPWAFARLGIDPQNALPEDRLRAEKLAEDRVDSAMKAELSQRKNAARASGRRGERLGTGGVSLGPRPSNTTSSQKRKLSSAEVKSYADANGWTPDQAASYLRSTGKYIVP